MSLLKLMKELQMIERILKDSKVVHMIVKDSSGSFLNRKKKYSFKIFKEGNTKVRKGKSKGKGKCFICGEKGH